MLLLRFVAGPIAAALLALAPATLPVFAQAAPAAPAVSSTVTPADARYLLALNDVVQDEGALGVKLQVIGTRMKDRSSNVDDIAASLSDLSDQWQSVTDRLDNLEPTPKYAITNMHFVVASQGLTDGLSGLSTAYTNRDEVALAVAGQQLKDASDLLTKAGTELSAIVGPAAG